MRVLIQSVIGFTLILLGTQAAQAQQWEFVTNQYQTFNTKESGFYRFGAGDRWTSKLLSVGNGQYCFFNPDPWAGKTKTCERLKPTVTYYFSSCDAGKQANCVPGDNNNNGLSPESPKKNFQGFSFENLPAGAAVLLARGGAWNANTGYVSLNNAKATASQRILIGAYTPSWGGSNRPLYVYAASDGDKRLGRTQAFLWTCGSETDACGNYAFEGIEFVGGAGSTHLFYTWFAIDNVTWRNNVVRGGGSGIFVNDNSTIARRSSNIEIAGNTISDMNGMGVFVKADGARVIGNHFRNNVRGGSSGDHHIYLACAGATSAAGGCVGGLVSGNDFEDNNTAGGGTFIVQHGLYQGLVIEKNFLRNTIGAAGGAYGISLSLGELKADVEGCIDCIVRQNVIVNLGQRAIDLQQSRNVLAEDNTIIYTRPTGATCFTVGRWSDGPNDIAQSGVRLSHNTCYFATPMNSATGIYFSNLGTEGGRNHQIADNLIYLGPQGDDQYSYCYENNLTADRFLASSSNACFGASARSGRTAGIDLHWSAVTADPQIKTPPTPDSPLVELAPTSPARGKGAR